MKAGLAWCGVALAGLALAQTDGSPAGRPVPPASPWEPLRPVIASHLGKPYVWGATGNKSFDCSGFLWRVMMDSGILVKRTTARKYFMCLPKAEEAERWQFGRVVFFSDLEHVGIVNDRDTFYHSQTSKGTNLSAFDPFWRPKIYGFRTLPFPPARTATPLPGRTPTPAS